MRDFFRLAEFSVLTAMDLARNTSVEEQLTPDGKPRRDEPPALDCRGAALPPRELTTASSSGTRALTSQPAYQPPTRFPHALPRARPPLPAILSSQTRVWPLPPPAFPYPRDGSSGGVSSSFRGLSALRLTPPVAPWKKCGVLVVDLPRVPVQACPRRLAGGRC